ncbi:MAG: efflux transporter protein [Hyphomicrobiales bacterium]|jgi:tripartite-type tricarboxylate transporter receptor subunit TctC|nr:efflux transporter protein [Hyphomicrobiales bacterium]
MKTFLSSAALLASLAATSPALAQSDPAAFYANKTVTVLVASSTGGGLDTYSRLVARHLGKHIPGNPTVVVQNMPGAGGNIVANTLYNISPKDGTAMGVTFPSVIVDPLLTEGVQRNYDATKFNYMGNAHSEVLVCVVRKDAGVDKIEDLQTKELIIGATAPGSTTADFAKITNGILDTKFKIVTGYKGSREVTMGIENKEVQGICGLGWSTVKVQYQDMPNNHPFARVFAQEDMKGHPELTAAGVPMMLALAKTDEQRQAMQMFYGQNAFARPFILPPGVAPERVALLRKAFMETMKDPELLAEAQKLNIDVVPSDGEQVQKLVADMYATPKPVIERVKAALARGK